jgi:hypothetical protein
LKGEFVTRGSLFLSEFHHFAAWIDTKLSGVTIDADRDPSPTYTF